MNIIGNYVESDIPLSRISTIDVCEMGIKKHNVTALIELDVTKARRLIKVYRNKTGKRLSFTTWMIKCISESIEAHKHVNSYINLSKRKLVTFEDIDITVIIEKDIDGDKVPLPYVIRKTNEKTFEIIEEEIKEAKTKGLTEEDFTFEKKHPRLMAFFLSMPQAIRKLFWKRILTDPYFAKKTMGTAVVTSVGMFGKVNGWVIPNTIFPLCFALGSVIRKPGVANKQIEVREYLCLTVVFDHDVIDGAPAARFIAHLADLIENARGL